MPTADPKKIEILLFEDNGVDVDLISEHLELSKLDFNISIALVIMQEPVIEVPEFFQGFLHKDTNHTF